jgi:hypothetical protein
MKSLIVMPSTVAAIFITYFSISSNSYSLASAETAGIVQSRRVADLNFCPNNNQIIARDLRSEGVITKIQAQSIKALSIVSIQPEQ